MRRLLIGLTILTLVIAVQVPGLAVAIPMSYTSTTPEAWLQVGNDLVEPLTGWVQFQEGWFLNFTMQTSLYTVSGNVATNGDPYISYGIAFNNNSGGDLAFNLGVVTDIAPLASPSIVYGSYSGSGTDVAGDGFHITPLSPDYDGDGIAEFHHTTLNGTVNAGVDVGQSRTFGPGFPGHSLNLGTYSSGPMPGPSGGPWTTLASELRFTLSGNDIATVNGYSSITPAPVPEPASLVLMGLGLIGTAFVARRKRN